MIIVFFLIFFCLFLLSVVIYSELLNGRDNEFIKTGIIIVLMVFIFVVMRFTEL